MTVVQQLVITNYKLLQNGSVAQIPERIARDAMTEICKAIDHPEWAVTITT